MSVIYECSRCRSYESSWLFALNNHLNKCKQPPSQLSCINNLETYNCEKCNFETVLKVDHSNHIKSGEHSGNFELRECEKFNCERCNVSSFSKYIIKVHQSRVDCWSTTTDLGSLKCKVCDKTVPTRKGLKLHVRSKHSGFVNLKTLYHCSYCPYVTKYKKSIDSHLLHIHTDPDQIEWFKCDQCSYQTKTKVDLKIHVFGRHTTVNKQFACDQCSYKSGFKRKLQDHVYYIHNQSATLYKCGHCTFKTKYKKNLKGHHLSFHSEQSKLLFSCDQCTYWTKYYLLLQRHINSKHTKPIDPLTGEMKWLECDQCNFKTNGKSNLRKHMVKHALTKEFKCEECPYRTSGKHRLRSHWLRRHSSKWFKCEHCNYCTRGRRAFIVHCNNKHADEHSNHKGITCQASSTSDSKSQLESDKIVWSTCSLCPRKFKNNRNLANHIKNIHTPTEDTTLFKCSQCEVQTKYKQNLARHVMKHGPLKERI